MGKKSSKQTQSTDLPKWAKGFVKPAAGMINNVVQGNQGNLDSIAGGIRGYLPQLGNMAFGQNPLLNSANGYASDVLGGKYLNGNQYLDGMIDQTADDVSDRVNSLFGAKGRSMGTQHASALTRELANAENSLRFGNYTQERQAQQQAAGMVPGLTASQYAGVQPYLAAAQTAGQLPYAGIQNLGQIGGLVGGTGTTTGTGPGWGQGLLGAAANMFSFAPISLSEREAKTDIRKIGEEPDGLGIYEFRYKMDPDGETQRGVMADEVEKLRPWALGPRLANGWRTVNYAELGAR